MPVSVRLDRETEQMLERAASVLGASKSEVIKKAIKSYCSEVLTKKKPSAYELTKDLLGLDGSGRGDLSTRAEEILRQSFAAKKK